MKRAPLVTLCAVVVALLLIAVGLGLPPWLDGPTRGYLEDEQAVAEWRVVYKPGVDIHVQAFPGTPFVPHVELWNGVGMIDSYTGQAGDTSAVVSMLPGGTVTNVLWMYVSGSSGTFPASFKVWTEVSQ